MSNAASSTSTTTRMDGIGGRNNGGDDAEMDISSLDPAHLYIPTGLENTDFDFDSFFPHVSSTSTSDSTTRTMLLMPLRPLRLSTCWVLNRVSLTQGIFLPFLCILSLSRVSLHRNLKKQQSTGKKQGRGERGRTGQDRGSGRQWWYWSSVERIDHEVSSVDKGKRVVQ